MSSEACVHGVHVWNLCDACVYNMDEELTKLRAENARLREAMTVALASVDIERYDVAMCRSTLRDALEGKGP